MDHCAFAAECRLLSACLSNQAASLCIRSNKLQEIVFTLQDVYRRDCDYLIEKCERLLQSISLRAAAKLTTKCMDTEIEVCTATSDELSMFGNICNTAVETPLISPEKMFHLANVAERMCIRAISTCAQQLSCVLSCMLTKMPCLQLSSTLSSYPINVRECIITGNGLDWYVPLHAFDFKWCKEKNVEWEQNIIQLVHNGNKIPANYVCLEFPAEDGCNCLGEQISCQVAATKLHELHLTYQAWGKGDLRMEIKILGETVFTSSPRYGFHPSFVISIFLQIRNYFWENDPDAMLQLWADISHMHADNVNLATEALKLLGFVLHEMPLRSYISANDGVISVIFNLMKWEDAALQKRGFLVLYMLTSCNPLFLSQVVSTPGFDVITYTAMDMFTDDWAVQVHGCCLIKRIAKRSVEGKNILLSGRAIEVCTRALSVTGRGAENALRALRQ
jgi:hypothetical protein